MGSNTFTLPCQCESRSLAWQDHAPRCPFAIMGCNRAEALSAARRFLVIAFALCGAFLGISLALLLRV